MRNLEICGGNASGGAEGGGIYFQGNGTLEIADSAIINNIAGYGAGIYARGTDDLAELQIGANVTISGNTARYSGGGVYVDQLEMVMRQPNSAIAFNTAQGTGGSGYGGGLTIRAANLSAYVRMGSSGIGTLGAIFGNEARYGGGVAVVGGDGSTTSDAQFIMFTTNPSSPGSVRDNRASVAGGGIFIASCDDNSGSVRSRVNIYNANIAGNAAPAGAAAYIAEESAFISVADLQFWDSNFPEGSVQCQANTPSGSIVDNVVEDADGNPAAGFRKPVHRPRLTSA